MGISYPSSANRFDQGDYGSPTLVELIRRAGQESSLQQSNSNAESPPAPFDPNFRRLSSRIVSPGNPSSAGTATSDHNSENTGEVNERPVPAHAGFGKFGRFGPINPPPPVSTTRVPEIPMPPVPEAWRYLGAIFDTLRRAGLGPDELNRCLRAAAGNGGDWENFCGGLPVELKNNVVGGQSARKACFSKTYESKQNKENWCHNQFGNH